MSTRTEKRRQGGISKERLILALLISASTVLIKQHSVLDILGALAFIVPLYIAVYVIPKKKERKK